MHKFVGAVLALILCLAVGMSSGATYYLYPDNAGWSTTLSSLQAGDTAIFAAYAPSRLPNFEAYQEFLIILCLILV